MMEGEGGGKKTKKKRTKAIRCQGRFSVTWWKSDWSGKRVEKREREKREKGEKDRYWSREAEESIVSHLFLENNLATRCEGVKNSGVKGRASTYRGSTDEQTRMKKGGEESEGSEGKGRETDGRERKVKEKKRREQKAGNCSGEESSDSTSVHNVSREKREGRGEEEGSEAARAN